MQCGTLILKKYRILPFGFSNLAAWIVWIPVWSEWMVNIVLLICSHWCCYIFFSKRKAQPCIGGSAAVEQPETRLSIWRGVTAEIWAMPPPLPQESLFLRGAAELTRAVPLWLEWHQRRALKMAPSARGSRCLLTPLNWVHMIHSDFLLAARSKPTNRWENFTPATTVRNCTVHLQIRAAGCR